MKADEAHAEQILARPSQVMQAASNARHVGGQPLASESTVTWENQRLVMKSTGYIDYDLK